MSKTLNRRLTTTDSSFLYFEKKEAAMHIGSVHLFEGEVPFEDFIAMMDAKMHLTTTDEKKEAAIRAISRSLSSTRLIWRIRRGNPTRISIFASIFSNSR